jgi:hypothetical protein
MELPLKLPIAFLALLVLLAGLQGKAQTVNAASCSTANVQTAINAAAEGGTVTIPAGICTWTSGVTISGKGITVTGAGSSRIIAISSTTLSLVNGSLALSVTGTKVGSALSISPGQTLTVNETGEEQNFMTGTVTSYSSGNLVMNITSHGGTCGSSGDGLSNCKRWLISTPATTTIVDSSTTVPLFNITEDTSVHTNICCMSFAPGTTQEHIFQLNANTGGQAILIHDCRVTANPNNPGGPDGNRDIITSNSNRGVVWNCSFDSNPFNVAAVGAVTFKDSGSSTSWTTPSHMGSLDTTGQGALYVESNDFHAFGFANGNDDNGRMVLRYNLYNNSGLMGTHGADTSPYGQRYFESYNNVAIFNPYTNGTTFNLNNWFYLRGGTGLIYHNTLPALTSQDYGNKVDVNLTVQNLQRNEGPDPCWGAGTSGGAHYHAPRQVGMGYVTGTGHDGAGRTNDANDYVGDLEPFYIWANSRSPLNDVISDYGSGNGDSCSGSTYDSSANYIVLNRDYYDGSTAKPSWSSYTYPHPLTGSGLTGTSASLSASNPTPLVGTNITLTATVTPSSGPTGTVGFYDGGSFIGTATLISGTAAHTVTSITAGTHPYTAAYGGDSNYSSSSSSPVTVTASGGGPPSPPSGFSGRMVLQ